MHSKLPSHARKVSNEYGSAKGHCLWGVQRRTCGNGEKEVDSHRLTDRPDDPAVQLGGGHSGDDSRCHGWLSFGRKTKTVMVYPQCGAKWRVL